MPAREDISRIVMGRGPTGDFGVWQGEADVVAWQRTADGRPALIATPAAWRDPSHYAVSVEIVRDEYGRERAVERAMPRSATESPVHGDEAASAAALLPGLIEARGLLLAARILGKTADEFALDLEYRILKAERAAHAARRS